MQWGIYDCHQKQWYPFLSYPASTPKQKYLFSDSNEGIKTDASLFMVLKDAKQ